MIELLAPAGTREAFKAAVESGADAVYLSGKNFGARAFADNFDRENLKEAVEFAHLRNTAVHVTVNTVVDNSELDELAGYLLYLYTIGVDAIIVQDLGAARLARAVVPDLPLHASTQMSINNLDSVKMMEQLGFRRVVLAREVSLEDISYICRHSHIEIETFIHGAICVCYSGQCLMSSMIGGRSGNRGRCAQPCRLPYTLVDEHGNDLLQNADAGQYLLSPRDLKTIDMLPELIDAGVKSFKIEGRMKKPEYVAIVVNAYRKKIDAFYSSGAEYDREESQKELSQIFNRDFTAAYLKNRPGKTMISDRRPNNRGMLVGRVQKYDKTTYIADIKLSDDLNIGDKIDFWVKVGGRVNTNVTAMQAGRRSVESAHSGDVISIRLPAHVQEHDRVFKIFDSRLTEKARAFFNGSDPVRRFPLSVEISARCGEPVKISISDRDGCGIDFTADFIAEKALKRPLTYETVYKQMSRLGNTIYYLDSLKCSIAADVMVPMSILNDLRRQAVDRLLEQRRQRFQCQPPARSSDWHEAVLHTAKAPAPKRPKLIAAADSLVKLSAALSGGCDCVLFGGDSYDHHYITERDCNEALALCRAAGIPVYLAMPRILRQSQSDFIDTLFDKLNIAGFAGIYAHTPGQIRKITGLRERLNIKLPVWADFSMNIFNNASIAALEDINVQGAVLSPELNMQQLKNIAAASAMPLETIVHGNLELMVSEYCAAGSFLGGLHKGDCTVPCIKGRFYLKDRKNEHFPVVTDQFCHMHILNGRELVMLAHLPDICGSGIDRIRIDGRYMNAQKLERTVRIYKEVVLKGKYHKIFLNGSIDAAEGINFTRGHFFRGILAND